MPLNQIEILDTFKPTAPNGLPKHLEHVVDHEDDGLWIRYVAQAVDTVKDSIAGTLESKDEEEWAIQELAKLEAQFGIVS